MLLNMHVNGVLLLVQLNNFALTTGFYWSYTLLLDSPVLMWSWSSVQLHSCRTRLVYTVHWTIPLLCESGQVWLVRLGHTLQARASRFFIGFWTAFRMSTFFH